MTKLIRVFVFTFVVFAIYFSLEQLAFKNTIFADSKKKCCENGNCHDQFCTAKSSWFNISTIIINGKIYEPCTYELTQYTFCNECLDLAAENVLCKPDDYPPPNYPVNYYCKNADGSKYYGVGSDGTPTPPKGLTTSWVSGNEETGNPRIDWTYNYELDIDYYEVWKRIDNYISPDVDWFIKDNVTASYNLYYVDYDETGWGTMGPPRDVYYKIKAVDFSNNKSGYSSTVSFLCDDDNFYKQNISDEEQTSTRSINYLGNNYPNPFNPATTISYSIAKQTFVEVIVYDILAKEVIKLVNEVQSKGKYNIEFNASSLPSGTYYYKINTNNFTNTKMMKLVK